MTETLERDKHGRLSSQPAVKSGPNRGKRIPETGGRWAYLCGCLIPNYDQSVVCGEVVRGLTREGFRLGHHDDDGVRSFYLWCGEHRREEEGYDPSDAWRFCEGCGCRKQTARARSWSDHSWCDDCTSRE